jgi:hypothetical protein
MNKSTHVAPQLTGKPSVSSGQEQWAHLFEIAKRWRDLVNRHGGDVTVVHPAEIEIRGNTHFMMSDLNKVQIAEQLSKFPSEKKLDKLAAKTIIG